MLIRNATIITQDPSRKVLRGDILVKGSRIAEIGPSLPEEDVVIEAGGKIAMPGLVNAHTHVGMTILRGYGEDLPLQRWLEEKIWPIEARQSAEDAAAASSLAFCEMIRGGTTSFADMCIHDPKGIYAAAEKIGIRGLLSRGLMDFNHSEWIPKVMKEMEASLAHGTELLKPSVAAHAPYTCSSELVTKTKDLARKKGLKFQMHCSETRKEIFDIQKKYGKFP